MCILQQLKEKEKNSNSRDGGIAYIRLTFLQKTIRNSRKKILKNYLKALERGANFQFLSRLTSQ